MNSMRANPTPRLRLHGCPECHFGSADIDHDGRVWLFELADRRARDVESDRSLIDACGIAFGAGDRDGGPRFEFLGRMCRPHYRGDTEFASHDGGMARTTAFVGDDARGHLHDRFPVRAGGRRHQDLSWLERGKVPLGRNAPSASRGDFLSDRATGDYHGSVAFEIVGLVDVRRTLRCDRLGPRLNDIEFPVRTVLCPFDIHWHGGPGTLRIVFLDPDGDIGKAQHLGVGNAKTPSFSVRHCLGHCGMIAAALAVDHAYLLAAEMASQHLAKPLLQRWLVDIKLVGIDLALNDGLAEPVTTRNENHVAKAGFRIEREDDAARREIGADHFHHRNGERDLEVIKSVVDAVGNSAVGEDGGKAAPTCFEQILGAAHVEKAFMLTRKACGRQIFCRGRAPYGDSDASP